MTAHRERLRQYMADYFRRERKRLDLTQEEMAALLEIDPRSYADLERGKSLCSTPVFLLYVFRCCVDTTALMEELKDILSSGGTTIL